MFRLEGNIKDLPYSSYGKESACSAGDPGSIPGLGRSSGEGNSNRFQNTCLENPMDRGAWWATEGNINDGIHKYLFSIQYSCNLIDF